MSSKSQIFIAKNKNGLHFQTNAASETRSPGGVYSN